MLEELPPLAVVPAPGGGVVAVSVTWFGPGVPEKVAMALSGHETRSVFDRYNIVAGNDLHDAIERLAAFHETRTTVLKGHLRDTQGPETNKTPRKPEGFAMEARGIEPRSEPRSEVALRA